jgi:hypothetical protein
MNEDDFNPETVLSDFEAATIKSISSFFPNVLHKGNAIIIFKLFIELF